MVATSTFGVKDTVIIPQRVKYMNVKNMKNTYHKNFATVHSMPVIE